MPTPSTPPRVLLGVIGALCLVLFVGLAWYVSHEGALNPFDLALTSWLQSHRTPAIDLVMLIVTYLCSWPMVVAGAIALALYWALMRAWPWIIALVFSLSGNLLLNSTIKAIVHRERPDQAKALLPANGSGFPSGHTFSAFALYGLAALFLMCNLQTLRLRASAFGAFILFVAVVGASRVYLGAHWTTDVLGSSLLGTAWLAITADILSILPTEKRPQPPTWPTRLGLVCAWIIVVVAYGAIHPITENPGSLGEQPAPPTSVRAK